MAVSLTDAGDGLEKQTWPDLAAYFPLYPEFWARHVLPLRAPGTIWIGPDVDERLELLAQEHYKCYAALAAAHDMIAKSKFEDPAAVYSHLQNCSNRARCVVARFRKLFQFCTGSRAPNTDTGLAEYGGRVAAYRNLVHEGRMGILIRDNERLIPRPDKLNQYSRWSRLLSAPTEDLVNSEDQIQADFDDLCKLLNSRWTDMLACSDQLLSSAKYQQLAGPAPTSTNEPPGYGTVLCSNTQLAASRQAPDPREQVASILRTGFERSDDVT